MEKKFTMEKFIEKEAEEDDIIQKIDKLEMNQYKDSQKSNILNNDDDNYDIGSDDDSDNIDNTKRSKERISHRLIYLKELNNERKQINNKNLKRKRIIKNKKKNNNKKRVVEHVKKNYPLVEESLGIINGKLNICFPENKKNSLNINKNKTNSNSISPTKNIINEKDEDIKEIKMLNELKLINNFSKNNNIDFINRIKENDNFIKNNIIDNDKDSNIEKFKNNNNDKGIIKNNSNIHSKLKIYKLKGAYLDKMK